MLKFEGRFEKGDRIRAYDFKPCEDHPDHFIEGVITEVGSETNGVLGYIVQVEFDSVFKVNPRKEVLVPYEVFFMEHDNRIEEIV